MGGDKWALLSLAPAEKGTEYLEPGEGNKKCISFVHVSALLWKAIFPGWGNFFFESEMTLMSSGLDGAKPPGNIRR